MSDPVGNTFQFLNVSITSPGTAERLTAYYVPPGFEVVLTAKRSNTQNMYFAETAAKAQSGARKTLIPGQSITLQLDNTARIFVDADNSTDDLEVTITHGVAGSTPG